jgi:hypothetical protein
MCVEIPAQGRYRSDRGDRAASGRAFRSCRQIDEDLVSRGVYRRGELSLVRRRVVASMMPTGEGNFGNKMLSS